MNQDLPHALDIEKYCLSLMIRHPEILPDVLPLINSKDFYSKGSFHESIFQVIRALYEEKKTVDKVIVIDRVRNLGLKSIEGVTINEYVDAISSINKVTVDKWKDYFVELKKYTIARQIVDGARNVERTVKTNLNSPARDLVNKSEKIFVECVTSYVEDSYKPEDLHEGMEAYIETLGEEGDNSIEIPFHILQKRSGGFIPGDLMLFAAPPGCGKSTMLNHLAINAALDDNNNCKALILDTELETERARRRRIAALSGVNEYYIRTGKWRKNEEMVEKIRNAIKICNTQFNKVDHLYVANKDIDEISSIVRRWAASNVEDGVTPLIVYDYLKLTGESVSESWKEYQVMGKKTDTLKHLFSDIGAAGLGAVQTNAAGDVAMAQQIKWFASNVYILEPKSVDEVAEHGKQWGTHKLTAIKERNQGEEATGFNKFITVPDDNGEPMLVENTIFYDFSNFNIREVGCLKDVYAQHAGHLHTDEDDSADDDLL